MKTKKTIATLFASLLIMVLCFTTTSASAQAKKECCMMKDGKMMVMKDGKSMPMDKDMKMANGTTCMVNGECVMKDGKKMMMKDGECMDMSGKLQKCNMMGNSEKMGKGKKMKKHDMAMNYTCSMHPEVMSDKPGKCPKCGMALVEKK